MSLEAFMQALKAGNIPADLEPDEKYVEGHEKKPGHDPKTCEGCKGLRKMERDLRALSHAELAKLAYGAITFLMLLYHKTEFPIDMLIKMFLNSMGEAFELDALKEGGGDQEED